ncbi:hypothetical protein RJ640_005883 [Escallonia rubra]|uniref:Elongation factor Ts, mitochondrial n=1 Tax=Escallonia rubra TaxID=112253 RepID=A0AA88QVW9_9ASTE|nr:hypothetical protein RJ640_005883 [Escallonia rubra]
MYRKRGAGSSSNLPELLCTSSPCQINDWNDHFLSMRMVQHFNILEMVFSRGARRSFDIFCKKLSIPAHRGHGYSVLACRGSSIPELRDGKFSCTSSYPNEGCDLVKLVRRYAVDVSASEQMSLIKQLRERTSAPIKDLITEAAQKELRKRGVVLANKKSCRTAAEGLLALAQNGCKAAIIELNCETDFVARNDIFQYLALTLAKLALLVESSQQFSGAFPLGPDCLEDFQMKLEHPKLSGERTVQTAITDVAAMMGENVKLRRGFVMSTSSHGIMSTYLHTSPQPGLGRIAGILSLEVEDPNASLGALQRVGSDLAMHVVAAKPLFLTKELVSSDAIENEREILKSQAEATGKPQIAVEKMVEGRMRKYFEEVVLMEQKFVLNDSTNVKTLLSTLANEVGSVVKIGSFLRMEVGEGLQR